MRSAHRLHCHLPRRLRRGRSNGALSDIRGGAERRNSQMTYLQQKPPPPGGFPSLAPASPSSAGGGDLLLAIRGYRWTPEGIYLIRLFIIRLSLPNSPYQFFRRFSSERY